MPLLFILFSYTGAHALLNENCTVSILNRTAQVKPDGKWIIPNVPSNMGKVRARATCVENGITRSGQSDWIEIQTDGGINIGDIPLEEFIPPPSSVKITVATTLLTSIGASNQLAVTATYPDGTTKDITNGAAGTVFRTTNPAIATVSQNGLVTAAGSGNVIISASNDMVLSSVMFSVIPGNSNDADNDGLPDGWELGHGLNPNNAIDAVEDYDHDGLTNKQEYDSGTDIRIADSDDDGIQDGEEAVSGEDGYITNPLLADSDGDGIRDGLEVQSGSNPLNAGSYNLAQALSGIEITPSNFVLIYNTIIGDATRQLTVTGILRDGTRIDLTSSSRGTNIESSDLNIANFGTTDGLVYAGQNGVADITATNNGFSSIAHITVRAFSPTAVSYLDIPSPGDANNVDVSGEYAYIAGGGGGLYIVDISNPDSPWIVSSADTPGYAYDVRVTDNTAFVADGSAGLQIIDVTDPEAPAIIGFVDTPGDAQDVVVSGTNAFIAAGSIGLQIIDISNLASPVITGVYATAGPAKGVDVSGNMAVVAQGFNGIAVIDVTDPAQPILLGEVDTPYDAVDLTIVNNTAYVADYPYGGLKAVDISNPSSPLITSTETTGGYLYDVAAFGNFAFGADVWRVNAVPIYDISGSNIIFRSIVDFSSYRDDNGTGIAVTPRYVFLTTGGEGYSRLYIGQYVDVTDDGIISPTVSITSPVNGGEVIEGSVIPVNVSATDDVMVASVSLLLDGEFAGSDNSAPYQVKVSVPVGITSLVLGATAIDLANNIGTADNVYLSVIRNQPPSASITAPSAGGTYMEGSTIILSADASDDVGVSHVVFLVNNSPVFTDSTRPYQTDYVIPDGTSGQITIGAKVEDTIGQVSYSPDVIINIIPDPKTTVRGRVLDINGHPIAGAIVTLSNEQGISGLTDADGIFSISGVPTVHGDIEVIVNVTVNGALLRGWSIGISPVPGGITEFGDVSAKEYELWAWGNNYDGQLGISTVTSSISDVKAIAGGECHSVAVKQDGTVWTWGCNNSGTLGNGTTSSDSHPLLVNNLYGVKAVAAGIHSTTALKEDGTVWAWGLYDSYNSSYVPFQISSLSGITAIASRGSHTLALKDDGTVWAWGRGSWGQLGDGTNSYYSSTPVQVSNLSDVIAISAGDVFSVALKNDGTVWAWGYNTNGQLGDGTTTSSNVPVQASSLSGVTAIAAGAYHNTALKEDGTVWAWGANWNGNLGDGTTVSRNIPVQVNNINGVTGITAGWEHSAALKGDGSVWVWGSNADHQLGVGPYSKSTTPIQFTGLNSVIKLAAGSYHTIALISDGTLRAWGYNRYGQLGDGTYDYFTRVTPAKVNNVTGFTSVDAGGAHTLGVLTGGTLWGWGSNQFGQLGIGNNEDYLAPVQIIGLEGIISAAGGWRHSAAVKDDGTVWGWGYNDYGQLGDGTYTDSLTPVLTQGIENVVKIAAGRYGTFAVKSDGTVWTWGDNEEGELGNGTNVDSSNVPVQAIGINGVVSIDAGETHAVVLKTDGTVLVWGNNGSGQLGDGSRNDKNIPQQVNGISGVTAVAAGGYHTVALKEDGTVWAWGDNWAGQLGIGTSGAPQLTPVQVTDLTDVVSIAAGDFHTVAVKRDGTVWTWGYNYSSQLGHHSTDNVNVPYPVDGVSGATTAVAGGQHTLVIK